MISSTARLAITWALIALIATMLSGCGKQPDPVAAPAAAPPSATASMARANPTAGGLEFATVKASAEGPTLEAAVDNAIRLAIEQVNGKPMQTSTDRVVVGATFAVGSHDIDLGAAGFAEAVSTRSKGVVTDFKLLSQDKSLLGGTHKVTIEARVAKFARPESANRSRVAVAPLRSSVRRFVVDRRSFDASEIEREVRAQIIEALTQTGRVAMLDREFTQEVADELAQIEGGATRSEDIARIGQQLAADYLLVGRIEAFGYQRHETALRTSDRKLVWRSGGATLSLRLVNVATRQIEFSDRMTITLPKTEPTTLVTAANEVDANAVVTDLSRRISELAGRKVALHLFPISVPQVNGDEVVLSQQERAPTPKPSASGSRAPDKADDSEAPPAADVANTVPVKDEKW